MKKTTYYIILSTLLLFSGCIDSFVYKVPDRTNKTEKIENEDKIAAEKLSPPTGFRYSWRSDFKGYHITISWNKTSGASYYEIYRKNPGDSDFQYYDTTGNTDFLDLGVSAGIYSYKVRACASDKTKSTFTKSLTVKCRF